MTLAALQRRLFGSGNRVFWSARDVERICDRFGLAYVPAAMLRPHASRDAAAAAVPRSAGNESRNYTFTISSSSVDRMGDTIAIDGWQLEAYRKNSVVLY